jgi:hypothetical protein
VTLAGNRASARKGNVQLSIELPQGLRCELVRGRENEPLGWVSRRFDQRTPTATLLAAGSTRGNARLLTRIELSIAAARSEARPSRTFANRGSSHEQRRAETEHL